MNPIYHWWKTKIGWMENNSRCTMDEADDRTRDAPEPAMEDALAGHREQRDCAGGVYRRLAVARSLERQ